jgi:hypothetical protein
MLEKDERQGLIRRRDEIMAQLGGVNDDVRIELDRDPEEQAIQLEQDEVATTREAQLRRELDEIEEKLLDLE